MENRKWKETSSKEQWQIINGTVLVFSAIILYFLSFFKRENKFSRKYYSSGFLQVFRALFSVSQMLFYSQELIHLALMLLRVVPLLVLVLLLVDPATGAVALTVADGATKTVSISAEEELEANFEEHLR